VVLVVGAAGTGLQNTSPLGLFCTVLFEGEEQRTPATLDSKWDHTLELYLDLFLCLWWCSML
jgi:hypothetical protein